MIINPSYCDDAVASMRAAAALGALVSAVQRRVVIGDRGEISGSCVDCGESGLCARIVAPIAALSAGERLITGRGSLRLGSMQMIEKPLHHLGAECSTNKGRLPIKVRGRLKGGDNRD